MKSLSLANPSQVVSSVIGALPQVRQIRINSKCAVLLTIALIIRLSVMPWSFHPWEAHTWINIGSDLYEGRNPYETGQELSLIVSSGVPETSGYSLFYEYIAYPPLWPLLLYPFYLLVAPEKVDFVFGGQMPAPLSPLANFTLKLPILLFDFASALVLFRLCVLLRVTNPWVGVWLWLFNPLVFTISAIWGNFESIVGFFVLGCLWAILVGHYRLSALSLGLAISTKLYPILLLPILLYAVLRQRGALDASVYFVIVLGSVLLVSFPFFIRDSEAFLQFFTFHGQRLGGGMTYYNFAWLASAAWGKSPFMWGINFTNLYFPIMLAALLLAYCWLLRFSIVEPRKMIAACALVILVFLASTKLVNEPYALWVLPFLLMISIYEPRFKWPAYFVTVIPLLFLSFNVTWPNMSRPYLLGTSLGAFILDAFTLEPLLRYGVLFALGCGFSVICMVSAFLICKSLPKCESSQ